METRLRANGARPWLSPRAAVALIVFLVVGCSAVPSVGTDTPKADDPYLLQVKDRLARFLVYPEEAIAQKQEGVVSVGFKFARDGTIIDAWIDKSSGYQSLDQAALKMVRAAAPLPTVPDQYKGDTFNVVIPETFKIGLFTRMLP